MSAVPRDVMVAANDAVISGHLSSALRQLKDRLKLTRGSSRFYVKAAIAMVESAQTLAKEARPPHKTSERTNGRGSVGGRASSMPKAKP